MLSTNPFSRKAKCNTFLRFGGLFPGAIIGRCFLSRAVSTHVLKGLRVNLIEKKNDIGSSVRGSGGEKANETMLDM